MIPTGPVTLWGEPDASGVRARFDKQRSKRFRYSERRDPIPLTKWPSEWRSLAVAWLRLGSTSVKQQSLFKASGNARHLAYDVLDGLLASPELPTSLHALASALLDKNKKGEQEALDLMAWI